jgi:hypothetical protein
VFKEKGEENKRLRGSPPPPAWFFCSFCTTSSALFGPSAPSRLPLTIQYYTFLGFDFSE